MMTMIRETSCRDFPLWLLGDSNPKNWATTLDTPLDPRHPARHSIWTSVLDVIQDRVYRQSKLRVDTSNLYIRNAIGDPVDKQQGTMILWSDPVCQELGSFYTTIKESHPIFVFCFGAFAYEFARRSIGEEIYHPHAFWGAKRLGDDFRKRVEGFHPSKTNIFPLLHVSIARGKFIESHEYFCDQKGANYFEYIGERIADLFLKNRVTLRIWIV
jgi:hypothetical protein